MDAKLCDVRLAFSASMTKFSSFGRFSRISSASHVNSNSGNQLVTQSWEAVNDAKAQNQAKTRTNENFHGSHIHFRKLVKVWVLDFNSHFFAVTNGFVHLSKTSHANRCWIKGVENFRYAVSDLRLKQLFHICIWRWVALILKRTEGARPFRRD